MPRRRKKPSLSIFSLSFLDVISCGFGAVILLFVMNDTVKKQEVVEDTRNRSAEYEQIQDTRAVLRARTLAYQVELGALEESLNAQEERLAAAREEIEALATQITPDKELDEILKEKENTLRLALQRRDTLRNTPPPWRTDLVGGIPADSEYVIFIVDTSGSMDTRARYVADKLKETLSVYPSVKGLQLMNADGVYLDPGSARQWLPGDLQGRRQLLTDYINWNNNSSSTPVRGILTALRDYGRSGRQVSIYILGDDFRGSIDELVETADQFNPVLPNGDRAVRIHAIGFGTRLAGGGALFAKAMRALTSRHGGAFVGLADEGR